jgi:hypothetical protein
MRFEIYENTLPHLTNWYDAVQICSDLGDNWRLPTIEELNLIFDKKKLGNYGCWSQSVPADNTLMVWSKGFETGNVYLNPKNNLNRIIPVRSLNVGKGYWASNLPLPLSPSDKDIEEYRRCRKKGTTLLLGCTNKLIPLSDRQLDIDPWYEADTVIIGDWLDNKNFYTNIIIDGGLCFTKDLCDGILKMASKNCERFIARSFTRRLDIMRIADYFPTEKDFEIHPDITIEETDYNFYIWEF